MIELADCDKNHNFSRCEIATTDFIHKSFRMHGLEQEKQRGYASLNLKNQSNAEFELCCSSVTALFSFLANGLQLCPPNILYQLGTSMAFQSSSRS